MCGIVGAISQRPVTEILLEGLRRLEYRGYDSAGVALWNGSAIERVRRAGKVQSLADALGYHPGSGQYRGRMWYGRQNVSASLTMFDDGSGDLEALADGRTMREVNINIEHDADEYVNIKLPAVKLRVSKADRYDAERPLEPWLVGILVNVTRNDRRRRQRDKLGAYDALPVDRRQPSDDAIESEFVAEVQRAIDTLPVP